MAGRSFLRRLLGSRSDAAGLEEVATPPSPAGPIHTPYPNATGDDDPAAVAKSTTLEDLPDGTSQTVLAGERVVADAEPTAFDEADAVFGQRTGVPEAKEVAPTQPTPTVGPDDGAQALVSDDGIVGMNGIISPNNVIADPDDTAHTQTSDDEIVGMNGIISPNNIVADPDEDLKPVIDAGDGVRQDFISMNGIVAPNNVVDGGDVGSAPSIDAGPGLRDGIIEMNGIVAPNNVIEDPDDDLVLADLSGGSIRDQLAANTGFSSGAADLEFADDLDDVDDLDVD